MVFCLLLFLFFGGARKNVGEEGRGVGSGVGESLGGIDPLGLVGLFSLFDVEAKSEGSGEEFVGFVVVVGEEEGGGFGFDILGGREGGVIWEGVFFGLYTFFDLFGGAAEVVNTIREGVDGGREVGGDECEVGGGEGLDFCLRSFGKEGVESTGDEVGDVCVDALI